MAVKTQTTSLAHAFTLGDIAVRQLGDLYYLNDLHKAAGSEDKHQPAFFMRRDETQDLAKEICSADSQIKAFETVRGRGKLQGTYVCRELVIAYAAWISAAFHLKVIRVFLDAVSPKSIPYTVQPGDKLNAKQQATLRELLETNAKRLPPEKQGPAIMRGWSKLKAHFKVGYRDIPAEQFTDAVSLLSRHVAELEVVEPVFPSINAAQLLLEGQSEHPLPNDVHTMIDRRAAEITVDAHMLIREHLQRRVSFRVNHYPDTSREQVADVLKEAELGNCLTHAYHSEVRRVLSMLGCAAQMAASSVQRLQAEMNALRPEPPTLMV